MKAFRSWMDAGIAFFDEARTGSAHEIVFAPVDPRVAAGNDEGTLVIVGQTERGAHAALMTEFAVHDDVTDRQQRLFAEVGSGQRGGRMSAVDHVRESLRVPSAVFSDHARHFDMGVV